MRNRVLIVVVVLVLIAAAFGAWWYWNGEKTQNIGPGVDVRRAVAGKIISGFPQELIVESSVPEESYSIHYVDGDSDLPVLRYRSGESLDRNVEMFQRRLSENGWSIIHPGDPAEVPLTFFLAYKESQQVNITLEKQAEGVLVNIAYLKKD